MSVINKALVGILPHVPRGIVRRFSARYIAGDTVDDAVAVIRDLNHRGMMATLDVLGEFITGTDEAEATARAYLDALAAIERSKLDSNVSVKLTSLGLLLDRELCFNLVDNLCRTAAVQNNFLRIDMEDSACTTDTLNIYRRLHDRHDNVGIVLQAYMKRSMNDIEAMLSLKPNVRVCKGIYVEPPQVAFQRPEEIRDNFHRMVETLLTAGCHVGIATHDETLVRRTQELVQRLAPPPEAYEFQMLLGVTEQLRQSIVDAGHRLRVYVPFGPKWYAYSVRRLKENPRIAGYVMESFVKRLTGNGAGGH